MSRILFLLLLLLAFCGSHATSTQRDTLVHFASDEHVLTADAIARLDAFLATIDKQADIEFSIAGHTDSDASQGYNEQLALRRSHAVREYLVAHGVPAEAITLRAFGERKAIASNNDEEGQATNRRVQVTCTLHQWETTADLQARLREGSEQTFSIDPSMDQTITTAAGIVLELPALALVDANGLPVTSTVRLNVTDAIGLDAILGHELSTRSGDQLIETAGMVKVEAIGSDGAPLHLDPTKPLNITLPASTQKDGMQLFLSNDGSDWNTAATSVTRSWTFTEPFLFAAKSPELKWPAMRKLDYHAPKNTLRKPIEPVYPREPKEPQRERFNSTYRWYRFVSRETLRHTDELRFAKALEQHTHALEKHTRRVAQYEEECAAYPQALEDFAAKTKAWEKEKLEHYAQWQKDVWQPAWEAHQRQVEAVRPRNDSILSAWRAERDKYAEAYAARMDSLGSATTTAGLQGYVLTTSRLGWINCDRFYNDPSPRTILAVADPDASDEEVYLVFTGIKSMLQMQRNDSHEYRLNEIPKNQPAVVFAYKVLDGKPMLCRQDVEHTKKMKLDFKPSSFAEIRAALNELNGTKA